jgi:hypothetical protein
MNNNQVLRDHLLFLLRDGGAHADFESVVADFPLEAVHRKIQDLPYTAWAVLEHMRIAQWDILEFCRNANHVSPKWPDDYWPERKITADDGKWNDSITAFRKDMSVMEELVANPSTDLFALIPHGEGQTILREILLVADHNAYHLGVLVTMKRLLGAMKDDG